MDNTIQGTNLAYPSNTAYLGVNAGTRNVKVNVTGTTTTVINADLALTAGAHYTVFAADSVSQIAPCWRTCRGRWWPSRPSSPGRR